MSVPHDEAAASQDWEAWREEFPILDETLYMVNHSLGAMPRAAFHALAEYAGDWSTRGIRAWDEGWWEMALTHGDHVAPVIGAAAGTVTMLPNVSTAMATVASALDFTPDRPKVVYTDLNFPTVMYVWEAQARRGAEICVVPSDDGMTVDLARLLEAIDERTAVVPISFVLFRSGWIQDAAAVCERAREVGAKVVLDCYQAVGAVPIGVEALGCDFACGGSVKFLCGGPGAGWLYTRPDVQAGMEPMHTGWAAHADPFAFETGPVRYADGPPRFLNGTPAIPTLFAAREGTRIIAEIGIEAVRERTKGLAVRVVERAVEKGIRVASPQDPDRRSPMVVLDVPDGAAVAHRLGERDILLDHRPGAGIRVAPHFYNTEEECERVVDEIAAEAAR